MNNISHSDLIYIVIFVYSGYVLVRHPSLIISQWYSDQFFRFTDNFMREPKTVELAILD